MDNSNFKRRRWNTIGFVVFVAYFLVSLGLFAIGRRFQSVLGIIQIILLCLCVITAVIVIINRIRASRKETYKKIIQNYEEKSLHWLDRCPSARKPQ